VGVAFNLGISAETALAATLLVSLLAAGGCAPMHQDAAQRALAAGRYDDAANEIEAALAHDPDSLQLKKLAGQIYTQRGVAEYNDQQMLAAGDDFHRAINYDPFNSRPYDYLGMLAFQRHAWADAIQYGNKAASMAGKPDPDYVKSARRELLKQQSGGFEPYLRPGQRPPLPQGPSF